MHNQDILDRITLPDDVRDIITSGEPIFPTSREHLLDLSFDCKRCDLYEVRYELPGGSNVLEATVTRCKNGVAINYPDTYMRRRDPQAMVIADDLPTDQPRFSKRFNMSFDDLRSDTFDWLKRQKRLIVMPFLSGDAVNGYPSLLIGPANIGFFATALADIQGFIPPDRFPKTFRPMAIIYVAPPFRHTHFDGKQVVVHNRMPDTHELFAYNLYPGPSAKKGVYGVLLQRGEDEGWLTLHCSTVRLTTPYDNEFVIMHEGASGSGKSEMTQAIHREVDGRILVGENIVTKQKLYIDLADTCRLEPITDDMALAPPYLQNKRRRLVVEDAEEAWFMRVDHLKEYGTEPTLEKLCISPPEPLVFINIDAQPGSTCILWEHIEDEPGKPCPNPRVIMPRRLYPNVLNSPAAVDVRSFGVRTPPCVRDNPTYGIIGMLHILPPALAWIWRLVSPRGHSNPSIVDSGGLSSEGVGSYWPFATGCMIRHANLLLEMIRATPYTQFVLIPNQHIGAYKVGFKPEWIAREYLARRGNLRFRPGQLVASRCPLLGYPIPQLRVNGQEILGGLLRVDEQLEVGAEGFDRGAVLLNKFFKQEVDKFYTKDLHPRGRKIIDLVMNEGSVSDYAALFSNRYK